ncbi:MAG: glutamate--tRNA ligase [Halanaerobiales bacterium]
MSSNVRVRFAPSPTGDLHIGGVRTALFNWLFARHHDGDFILRIEVTDEERSSVASTEQIISAMDWLGLERDEGPETGGDKGPYFQSRRQTLYQKALNYLLEQGHAYHCYCSEEEVEQMKQEAEEAGKPAIYPGHCRNLSVEERKKYEAEGREPVVRLKTPHTGETTVSDIIRGEVSFDNSLQGDFVIAKTDGSPTYNFACVVDDNTMEISHVIRADEHLSNTPKQIMVYQVLDLNPPEFAHVPMILAPDRSKLSKRHGATSVDEFKEQGYLPEGLINYLLLLGWSPGNNQEVIDLETAIRRFELSDVSQTASVYDTDKLTWLNGKYMRKLPLEKIVDRAMPFIEKGGYLESPLTARESQRLEKIIDAVRERARTLEELVDGISYFYDDNFEYEKEGVDQHFTPDNTETILKNCIDCLETLEKFNRETIEDCYRQRSQELGVKAARMIHTTRLALSGRTFGPGLFTLVELVGQKEALKRLKRALEFVKQEL